MENKNLAKRMYESVGRGCKNFWNNWEAMGLTAGILFLLTVQGPLFRQPENIESKVSEPIPNIQQKEDDENILKDYINNLPKELRDFLYKEMNEEMYLKWHLLTC
jgi:hypothetical protein